MKNGNLAQIGVNMKNIWTHHLDIHTCLGHVHWTSLRSHFWTWKKKQELAKVGVIYQPVHWAAVFCCPIIHKAKRGPMMEETTLLAAFGNADLRSMSSQEWVMQLVIGRSYERHILKVQLYVDIFDISWWVDVVKTSRQLSHELQVTFKSSTVFVHVNRGTEKNDFLIIGKRSPGCSS